ncbi:Fc receptor-like protein 5 [Colossoma macropomum]|uniref:Fc receptor-like protein 5 n=1 Tax=Colossoma macropomum TaxID=42526 RepID=UPI001863B662|nr:Fc receptor-like protein 5 [Colossoma macropomum]
MLLVSLIQTEHAQVLFSDLLVDFYSLTVQPDQPQIFTGENVTLTCDLPGENATNRTYCWMSDNTSPHLSDEKYHIKKDIKAHQSSKYKCHGHRNHEQSDWSNEATLTVIERPKASLILVPTGQMFTGEKVTLRCDIQGHTDTEWSYSWYKDGDSNLLVYSSDNKKEYSFSVVESDSGKYTYRGERRSDSQISEVSDAVTLTVSDRAQAVLRVSPQSWLTEGDSVTLSCEVRGSSTGWTFSLYRNKDVLLSDSSRGAGGSYTLSPATLTHVISPNKQPHVDLSLLTHHHHCVSPLALLMVSPSRTQHFITDSLSLRCVEQSDSTGWRVGRYTHSEKVSDCSSGWGSVTGSTCSISSINTSHTGVYWCESESGESSSPVNITVHNNNVILDSPVHPVTEGDPLTLHCLYRHTKPSNLTAEFYKDGSLLQTQTTGEMTIHTVSKSDEGLYHCKHPERGESPQSWISVRGVSKSGASFSVFSLLSSLMAVSPYLLVSIVLGFKCYRARGKNSFSVTVSDT